MITVSFVNELQFVAKYFNDSVSVELKVGEFSPLKLTVDNDVLSAEYMDNLIWKEKIAGADSNFGVESCQIIFKIMQMSAEEDYSWKKKIPYIFA